MRGLFIGINYTGTSSALAGCINDVRNMISFYKSNFGLKDKDIKLLVDSDKKNLPTKKNILDGIKWLLKDLKDGEQIIFHYSGHGSYVRDNSGDEIDKRDECLVPLDYIRSGFITDDDLYLLLVKKVAEKCKLFSVLDACHSGTGMDLKYNYIASDKSDTVKIVGQKEDIRNNVVMLSGCKDEQTSADTYEVINGRLQAQGALTWALLSEWQKDNNIKYADLIRNVRKLLLDSGYTQVPQLSFSMYPNLTDKIMIENNKVTPTKPVSTSSVSILSTKVASTNGIKEFLGIKA